MVVRTLILKDYHEIQWENISGNKLLFAFYKYLLNIWYDGDHCSVGGDALEREPGKPIIGTKNVMEEF